MFLCKPIVWFSPANNFAENLLNSLEYFPGIRENSKESLTGKSGKNVDRNWRFSREFPGKEFHWEFPGKNTIQWQGFGRGWRFSCDYFPGIYIRTNNEEFHATHSEEFLTTHSEEFLVNRSCEFFVTHFKEFLVTHSEKFLTTLSEEFLVTYFREFLWSISREKVDQIWGNSWEFPEKYLQIFLAYFWVNSLIRT